MAPTSGRTSPEEIHLPPDVKGDGKEAVDMRKGGMRQQEIKEETPSSRTGGDGLVRTCGGVRRASRAWSVSSRIVPPGSGRSGLCGKRLEAPDRRAEDAEVEEAKVEK